MSLPSPPNAATEGLGNNLIDSGNEVGRTTGTIECRERLGGLLRYYRRRAA